MSGVYIRIDFIPPILPAFFKNLLRWIIINSTYEFLLPNLHKLIHIAICAFRQILCRTYAVRRSLREMDALAPEEQEGSAAYYASDRVEDFERMATIFLRREIGHTANQIDIEKY